jgi:hypothetical protein
VDGDERLRHQLCAHLQRIQHPDRGLRIGGSGDQANRALRLEVKLGGERGVYYVELATGVDHEVIRAGLVDAYGNHEQGPGDNAWVQAGDVCGATSFCVAPQGRDREPGGEKDSKRCMEREFHVCLRSRSANRRRH